MAMSPKQYRERAGLRAVRERRDKTRAGKFGKKFGEVIVEAGHLMYQNRTAYWFFVEIVDVLNKELTRREKEVIFGRHK